MLTFPYLERVIAGFVQVVQGSSSLHAIEWRGRKYVYIIYITARQRFNKWGKTHPLSVVYHGTRGFHLFLLGAAWFWRSVALQFLHQQLAAAAYNVPEFVQRAAALERPAAVLQRHTPSPKHPSHHMNSAQLVTILYFLLNVSKVKTVY